MPRRLLLLSNSTNFGEGYLDHATAEIEEFLGPARRIAFVPLAVKDQVAYWSRVRDRFRAMDLEVENVNADPRTGREVLESAEAVFVGGGNTFRLLELVRRCGL